jgi:ATP-dependent exoDNAse (exonuclease V) beta subunit
VTQARAATLLQDLTGDLHRLRVSTLDSFFQKVARSLTLELGLSPAWTIVEEYADSNLRQRAIDAVLAERDALDSRQLMQMLAKGRSRRSIRSLIDEAVEGYYELFLQTNDDAWDRIPRSKCLSDEDCQICLQALQAVPLSGKQLPKTRLADLQRFQDGNWTEFLTKGISAAVSSGKSKFARQDLAPELVDGYTPLVRHAQAETVNQIALRNRAVWKLIARFDTAYQQLRRDTGFTRFSEITRLLARSGDVVQGHRVDYRLDSSLRHLLLDEFQDTSLDQWNVLKRLVKPLVSGDVDEPCSVFCVGDPKQAIYGWRGGVAEIMDEVESAVPGIEADTLDLSRRSAPAVIDTVNHVFQRLHEHKNLDEYGPACFEWSQSFPPHSTHRTDLPGFAEFRTSPKFDDDSEPDKKTAYNNWVAKQVREINSNCPGAEVGVLMRTNHGVAQLVHQLNCLGVPASEEGGTPPTDSPAVLAVMSLLYLASHPGCTASRYHVAQSPLVDIVGLHQWEDDGAAMAAASSIRRRLLDDGYGATLQWITDSVAPHCNQRDQLRLQQVVAEAWRYDSTPSLNPAEFVRLLETAHFSRSATAPVRVMTVHQSKGLEFDIVVAPELTGSLMMVPAAAVGGPRRAAAPEDVCVWTDKGIRHVLPQRLQDAFTRTTSDGVRGALCLLYVTLTRAIHALHLLTPPDTTKTKKTLAGLLTATFSENDRLDEDSQIWATGRSDWYLQVPPVQRPATGQPAARQARSTSVRLAPMPDGRRRGLTRRRPSDHAPVQLPLGTKPAAVGGNLSSVDGRARGTLMHAWFSRICWLDVGDQPTLAELRAVAQEPALRELRLSDDVLESLLSEFLRMVDQPATQTALSRSVAHDRLSRQLAPEAPSEIDIHVMTERPFVYRHQGGIIQGTIDRLVIAEQAGRPLAAEIIDFKTDRFSGDRARWMANKESEYGSQLRDYRTAVTQCFRIPGDFITTSLLLLEADASVAVI